MSDIKFFIVNTSDNPYRYYLFKGVKHRVVFKSKQEYTLFKDIELIDRLPFEQDYKAFSSFLVYRNSFYNKEVKTIKKSTANAFLQDSYICVSKYMVFDSLEESLLTYKSTHKFLLEVLSSELKNIEKKLAGFQHETNQIKKLNNQITNGKKSIK
jgi:hypothetical protein